MQTAAGGCTMDFVYDGLGANAGKTYVETAAHCVSEVDESAFDSTHFPFGTVAFIEPNHGAATDFAFIEVQGSDLGRVDPAMKGHPQYPTGVTTASELAVGDLLQQSGFGIGFDQTQPTQEQRQSLLEGFDRETYWAGGPGIFGDSGGRQWVSLSRDFWRRVRRVLGRIPSGSAFAALPLAAVLTAASQGWCWLTWFAGLVLAATVLWMFAPWIPGLKDLLPTRRRVDHLEHAWANGQRLLVREVPSLADLTTWKADVSAWENDTQSWITEHISGVDGLRFYQPHYLGISDALGEGFNFDHTKIRNRIVHQLDELGRVRDEQERKLH